MEETFTYDNMNRLTGITLKRSSGQDLTCAVTYDALGRMTSRQAVTAVNLVPQVTSVFSQPVFDATKVHALASATAAGVFPPTPQTITYTGFDKVSKVKQGTDSICYTYGYDHQRIYMEEHVGNTTRTKRYVGSCEYQTETAGNATNSRWLTYLSGPTGVYAVVVTENNTHTVHYVLKDNLGSWTTITNASGTVEQQLSYDAWGNLRNPVTWSGSFTGTPMFDRGFTGHEHLYNFGLINMNGRMYDPVTSSFLSVDQYVQSPENAQGFNRYAYCMNNPLRYVDPSGWLAGGGNSGYTPNSSANAFDPYMFYGGHVPLEPRDLGIRQFETADPIITWMEENSLHGSGNGPKGGWYLYDSEIYWSPEVSSQADLKKLGMEEGLFIGRNFTDELNNRYYSLLGYIVDMNEGNGLAGKIAPLIDEAFLNYETNRIEWVLYNNSPLGDEPQQKWTNFIKVIAYNPNKRGLQEYSFKLGPIEGHLMVGNTEKSMEARIEYIDLNKTIPDSNKGYGMVNWPSGYDIKFISKASYNDSNPRNSHTVILIIPPSHWGDFKSRYNSVFPYNP